MKLVRNNQKGFTLVELLAVIVILGIIAMIAVPAIGNIIEKSREDALEQSILMVRDSAEAYFLDNPATTKVTLTVLVEKGYLRSVPKNPKTNTAFTGAEEVVYSGGKVTEVAGFTVSGDTVTVTPKT
ncbi:prepilin-type N-terminal cleavage/methylation domain-containing protein [Paenibacillus sp. TRM 82003]|nr:prepilin-type N-terminal cleavage/methylation domain-containing protein [Paenibacillus sp. TRM 82003]